MPAAGENSAAYLSGMNLIINTFSQHKREALQFIKFCARPDIQLRYARMIEAFPAFEEAFDSFVSSAPRLQIYKDILRAEAEKQTKILAAEAEKAALIAKAEGERQAIELINNAKPSAAYITLQGYEALKVVADGNATKLIVPSNLQDVAGLLSSVSEIVKNDTTKTSKK